MLKNPRTACGVSLVIALLSSLFLPVSGSRAIAQDQQPGAATVSNKERGIELYKHGELKDAIQALRAAVKESKDDADAWYYLSLALNRDNDFKGARKAVENTVKLRPDFPAARAGLAYFLLLSNKLRDALREAERTIKLDAQNAEAHYIIAAVWLRQNDPTKALEEVEAALKYKPSLMAGFLLKSQILLGIYSERTEWIPNESPETRLQRTKGNGELLKQAAESLEKYLQQSPPPPNADVWREQLATLRVYSQTVKQDGSNTDSMVYAPSQVTTKARLLSRAEPQYTEEARRAQVNGTVVLRAVFAADGTVQNILVLHSLPYGLTEEAVRAARKVKFVPATKDGHPVSQFIQIEYNFNLY